MISRRSSSLERGKRQIGRFEAGQVQLLRCPVDVDPHDVAVLVEVHVEAIGDLARLGRGRGAQLDIEAVRLRIIMQLHRSSSRNPRSRKALWIVLPSSSVTTRKMRISGSPGKATL